MNSTTETYEIFSDFYDLYVGNFDSDFNFYNIEKKFDELLDVKHGKLGSEKRDEFEIKAKAFVVGEMFKAARKEAHLTQEELAEKTGTKKSYISRLENGKIDIQIYTLFKIFEKGSGKRLGFTML